MIKERFAEHRGYVNTKNKSKTTGAHFNTRGHATSDMEITVIEKVFNQDAQFRKQREKLWIQKFNTRYRGLNRINGGWTKYANCKPFFKKNNWFQLGTVVSIFDNVNLFWVSQSDVVLIKSTKYITDRILGLIFWSGNLLPFTERSWKVLVQRIIVSQIFWV